MKRNGSFIINIAIAAALFTSAAARPAPAADTQTTNSRDVKCTNASLKGSYGALLTGTIPGVGPLATIAVAKFDGAGGWSYRETANVNGNVSAGQQFVGTYSVAADCSGSTTDSGGNSTALVVVNRGQEAMAIGTGGAVFSLVLKKILSSDD